MFELFKAATPEARLLRTCEGLLDCRAMSKYFIGIEELEALEAEHSVELFESRALNLWDRALDLTNGGEADEWDGVMQAIEGEVAKLHNRPERVPWNDRTG